MDGDTRTYDASHYSQSYQITSIRWIIVTAMIRERHAARSDDRYDHRHGDDDDTTLACKKTPDWIVDHGQALGDGQTNGSQKESQISSPVDRNETPWVEPSDQGIQ